MKTCRECKLSLPLTEFYTHPRMADGHLNKCKECVKFRVMRHREENIEDIRAYDRARGFLPHRIEARTAYWKALPGEYKSALSLKWAKRNPQKRVAQIIASNAIRDGKLIRQPCEKCGDPVSDAHHDDYSKPLTVRWLCRKHHAEHHRFEWEIARLDLPEA